MILERIDRDLTSALKEGDQFKKEALRYLKSVIQNATIEKGRSLTDEELISLIQKELKRRQEASDAYAKAGASEQARNEQAELSLLQGYLPTQMSEDELHQFVAGYLAKNPQLSGNVGQTMGAIAGELKGRADLGLVAKILREGQSG